MAPQRQTGRTDKTVVSEDRIIELTGEPVNLRGPEGELLARGLVSFDSEEIPSLMGKRTADLAAERGAGYDRAVVHRDVLIVL